MTRVVLTDSDRFPFGPADMEMLSGAGVALDQVPGHDPDAIAAAAAGAEAFFIYSAKFHAALIGRLEGCRGAGPVRRGLRQHRCRGGAGSRNRGHLRARLRRAGHG